LTPGGKNNDVPENRPTIIVLYCKILHIGLHTLPPGLHKVGRMTRLEYALVESHSWCYRQRGTTQVALPSLPRQSKWLCIRIVVRGVRGALLGDASSDGRSNFSGTQGIYGA